MKLNRKKEYKLQQTIDDSRTAFILIIVYCFTALFVAIPMYLYYRTMLNACEDEDEAAAQEAGNNINICIILGVIWSTTKILLISYGLFVMYT